MLPNFNPFDHCFLKKILNIPTVSRVIFVQFDKIEQAIVFIEISNSYLEAEISFSSLCTLIVCVLF